MITGIFGGIGWLFKARREDKLGDLRRIDQLQNTISVMQQDRIKEEIARRELLERANREASENTALQAQLIALLRELRGKDAA